MNEAPSFSDGKLNIIEADFFLLKPLTTYSTLNTPLESVNDV